MAGRTVSGHMFVAPAQTAARRVLFGRTICTVADYIGGAAPRHGAQVYAMNLRGGDFRPHTHPVAQFRILWSLPAPAGESSGTAGPGGDPGAEVVVCYTDAYTPTEVLTPSEPLRAITLRADPTDAIAFPGLDQDARVAPNGRSLHARATLGAANQDSGSASGSDSMRGSVLFEDAADAVRARLVDAGPGAEFSLPAHARAHRFAVVLAGEVAVVEAADDEVAEACASFPAQSVGWLAPGAEDLRVRACAAGASVVVLEFPVSAP